VASAQNMGRSMPTFESFDLNKDGTLTESEMNEARALRAKERQEDGKMLRNSKNHYEFSDIDTSKDGVVDKKEFQEHQLRRKR
ncbi:MAG: EF-hand domain-containing protein, partial [Sulfurimonas denitrificans]|nr:EF-hand domain-containing protein [Sulfurimonas denitrificans]